MDELDLIFIHYVVVDEYFSDVKDYPGCSSEEELEYSSGELSEDQRGIVSVPLFLSALHEPKQTFDGRDLYPDILIKGAAYLRSFALNHSFANGNKRTAILATIVFLEMNGYECVATTNKLIRLARTVVIRKLSPKQIKERFLKKYFKTAERRKRRDAYIEENKRPIISWLSENIESVKDWVNSFYQ